MYRAILTAILTANLAIAYGQADSDSCEMTGPAATPAALSCEAGTEDCATWLRFRSQHPVPYQTLAVDRHADSGTITLIVSEPPPIGSPIAYIELLHNTFDVAAEAIHPVRFPVGLDGWLEDLVVTIPAGGGKELTVSGGDTEAVSLPADLVNRLQFLSTALFGTRSGFYVETVPTDSAPVVPRGLPDLHVPAGLLEALAADVAADWQDVTDQSAPRISFASLTHSTAAQTLFNSQGVVSLVIPFSSDIGALRAQFRVFSVDTDYLIGAIRPTGGALVLLGRARVVPLNVLPPMRFETLASLSDHLGKALGQSYERQQLFAGKISSGAHAGWDWAPIYLSTQLQDTEFGTLLNIADQELKSWSECSRVHYASFDYPPPDKYPFGTATASSWVFERTLSPQLIFNWNTKGFAVATRTPQGRIVTSSGTAALPVLYIVPDDPRLHALRAMLARQGITPADNASSGPDSGAQQDPELAASDKGSGYFAGLGDPVLVRVARNVLLYQILGDASPFRARKTGVAPEVAGRSDLVTNVLISEATPWIREVMSRPAVAKGPGGSLQTAQMRSRMSKLNLSVPQLAELIAKPQLQGQRVSPLKAGIIVKETELKQLDAQIKSLYTELLDLSVKAASEFKRECRDIHGDISELEKGTLRCSYQSAAGQKSAHLHNSYGERIATLTAQEVSLETEGNAVVAKLKSDYQTLGQLFDQEQVLESLGSELRERSSLSDDLDGVLSKVLRTTAGAESHSFIQTPSVVLSRNVIETQSVGGHNIDGLPWEVRAAQTGSVPHLHWSGETPTVIVPREQVGDGAVVARELGLGHTGIPEPETTLPVSLGLTEGLPGSFLNRLNSITGDLPVADASVLDRAKLCACDIYVERMDANTSAVILLGPPPALKTVFGDSAVVESLASGGPNKKVLFAQFPTERVIAISEGARRSTSEAGPKAADTLFGQTVEGAKRLFERGADAVAQILQLRTASARTVTVASQHSASHISLAKLLAQRPAWEKAGVVGRSAGASESSPLVEVQFSASDTHGDLLDMRVFVRDAAGAAVNTDSESAVSASRTVIASLMHDAKSPDVQEAVEKLAERMYRDNKDATSVDIFLRGVDKYAVEYERPDGAAVQIAARE